MQVVIRKENQVVLTEKQLNILVRVAEGETLKQISEATGISHRTLDGSMLAIRKSLGCKNVAHLMATLFREGVLK